MPFVVVAGEMRLENIPTQINRWEWEKYVAIKRCHNEAAILFRTRCGNKGHEITLI